jgi:serine/threonine protein kinase
MFHRIIIFILLIQNKRSVCQTTHERDSEYQSYVNSSGKLLGQGGFGSVREIKIGEKDYAVKEVDMLQDLDLQMELKSASDNSKTVLNSFKVELENKLYFNFIQDDKVLFDFIKVNPKLGQKTIELLFHFYSTVMKNLDQVKNEISILQKLKEPRSENPKSRSDIFQFCIKASDFKVLLFFDRHLETLRSHNSQIKLQNMSQAGRFRIFLDILLNLREIHMRKIVHCDVKPENIIFMNDNPSKVLIIDFGLSTHAKLCRDGTAGYSSPESFRTIPLDSESIFSFNADIYTTGLMFAEIEYSTVNPTLNLRNSQANLERLRIFPAAFSFLTKDLLDYTEHIIEVISRAQNQQKENYSMFYSKFKKCIEGMMEKNVYKRFDLESSYKCIWELAQLSTILNKEHRAFKENYSGIEDFTRKFGEKNSVFQLETVLDWIRSFRDEKGILII